MARNVELARVDTGPDVLGESPVWSEREGALYRVDIDDREIHRFVPDAAQPGGGHTETRELPGRPGALALTATPGRLLVAMEHQLVWFTFDDGTIERWLQLEEPGTGNRLNDGRADPAGRFLVGSMYEDTGAGKQTGILHLVDADGTHRQLRHQIGVSNGSAFDPERGRMYWADSKQRQVLWFHYDLDTGRVGDEHLLFDYADASATDPMAAGAEVAGSPDGACLDAEGCYWSASVHGSGLLRITPQGTIDRRIELPLEMPTMPAFGGPDLSVLYVTSIDNSDRAASIDPGYPPGSVLQLDVGVHGVPEPLFSGA